MEKIDAAAKMRKLIEYLNHHQDLYDAGTPQISDTEWDKAYLELKALETEFPSLIMENSPTQKIRYTVLNELKKVKHEYQPMLSLDKTKDIEEIKRFLGDKEWIAMLKLDGLTCRLTYEEGRLVRAETRGDGYEGEDITHNAMVMPSIPKVISYTDTLVVDGEVICDRDTFEQFKNEYANARNFAAGSIRLLDSNECAKRGLTFVAWDLIKHDATIFDLSDKLGGALVTNGFTVVPFFLNGDYENIEDTVDTLAKIARNKHYPIDGIVFKWDNCAEYESAGRTEHHFRGGMAFKFEDEEYETTLQDIEWTLGRTGVLTPTAIYEETEIDGTICKRASLHNVSIMHELFGPVIQKGERIWVFKANMINPQVARTEKLSSGKIENALTIPDTCPVCGEATEIRESDTGTVELYCANNQCPGKLATQLDHFCSIKGLNIKGLSKATIEKLIEWGWVETIVDLFLLNHWKKEWIKKPGFGEKSVQKILDAIAAASHTELSSFIAAIGIPLIGKSVAKEICKYVDTWEEFRSLIRSNFDFTEWDGFGPEKDRSIKEFDYLYVDYIVERGFIQFIHSTREDSNTSAAVRGLSICVTGKLKTFHNRSELKTRLESLGAKVTDSVSVKTSYLVNNNINSTSSKNLKAKELNIPIITEQELLQMIGE